MNQDQTIAASEVHVERVGICMDSGISEADAEAQGQKERERYIRSLDVRQVMNTPPSERSGFLNWLKALKGEAYANAVWADVQAAVRGLCSIPKRST